MYHDRTLHRAGLRGEGHSGRDVVAVKSHLAGVPNVTLPGPCTPLVRIARVVTVASLQLVCADEHVIHLVRHPLSALVAERKRLIAGTITYWNSHVMTPPWTHFLGGLPYYGKDPDPYARSSLLPWYAIVAISVSVWACARSF